MSDEMALLSLLNHLSQVRDSNSEVWLLPLLMLAAAVKGKQLVHDCARKQEENS